MLIAALLINKVESQTPPTLPPTTPCQLSKLYCDESGETITGNTWSAQYKDYRLTQLTMYKNGGLMSGFEVTYSVPMTHIGWPDEVHLFGTTDQTG